jgi:hypothetical protein
MATRLLQERTGKNVDAWNRRVKRNRFTNEPSLRAWLAEHGVTGYPQSLLVMERLGYPDYYLASAEELIGAQYSDRLHLRPILDAIIDAAAGLDEIVVQARKGYVSLVTPRRTFARVQATTKTPVDLCLRLEGQKPTGRLRPSKLHENMAFEITLATADDVDSEVLGWLQKAFDQNSKPRRAGKAVD